MKALTINYPLHIFSPTEGHKGSISLLRYTSLMCLLEVVAERKDFWFSWSIFFFFYIPFLSIDMNPQQIGETKEHTMKSLSKHLRYFSYIESWGLIERSKHSYTLAVYKLLFKSYIHRLVGNGGSFRKRRIRRMYGCMKTGFMAWKKVITHSYLIQLNDIELFINKCTL